MADITKVLKKGVDDLDLNLTTAQLQQLITYKNLLQKWNKAFSLTAIVDDYGIATAHILDGLASAKYFAEAQSVLDVGSGMGVPAVLLAIVYPDKQIVALDSNSKKTAFLLQVKIELKLTNLQVVTKRVEDYSVRQFDVITSRAFANMELFVKLTQHLLNENGRYLALKGEKAHEELESLHGWSSEIIKLDVPYLNAQRFLIKLERNEK